MATAETAASLTHSNPPHRSNKHTHTHIHKCKYHLNFNLCLLIRVNFCMCCTFACLFALVHCILQCPAMYLCVCAAVILSSISMICTQKNFLSALPMRLGSKPIFGKPFSCYCCCLFAAYTRSTFIYTRKLNNNTR